MSGDQRRHVTEGLTQELQRMYPETAAVGNFSVTDDPDLALVWLYLATERLGEDGKGLISGICSRAHLSQWPGPAVMLMLGESTPEEVLSAAWSFDRKTELRQRCEAYFFLAEYRLLKGDRAGALAAFKESYATGVRDYVEYAYSRLELARLQDTAAAKRETQ